MNPAPLSPAEIENGTNRVSFSFQSSVTASPGDINPLFNQASVPTLPGAVPPASSGTGTHLGSEDAPAPAPSPSAISPDDVPPLYLLMPQNPRLFRVPTKLCHLDHHEIPFPFNYVAAGQRPPSFQTEPIENYPFFYVVLDGGRYKVVTNLTSLLNTLQSVSPSPACWLPCATREQADWFSTTGYLLVESFNSQDLEWYLHSLHQQQNNRLPAHTPFTSPNPLPVPPPKTPHGVPVDPVPFSHPPPPQAANVTPLSSIGDAPSNGGFLYHTFAQTSPPLHPFSGQNNSQPNFTPYQQSSPVYNSSFMPPPNPWQCFPQAPPGFVSTVFKRKEINCPK